MINREQLLDSLDQLDDALLLEADRARQQRTRRRLPRGLTAAACVLLVLLATLTVEARSGAVSSLLAPLFGGTRTEIVDHIGSPIGASVSADGYTITADAIIGDRYNLAVVYTLTRDDGQPLPENLRFQEWETRYKFLGFFGIGSGGGRAMCIKSLSSGSDGADLRPMVASEGFAEMSREIGAMILENRSRPREASS